MEIGWKVDLIFTNVSILDFRSSTGLYRSFAFGLLLSDISCEKGGNIFSNLPHHLITHFHCSAKLFFLPEGLLLLLLSLTMAPWWIEEKLQHWNGTQWGPSSLLLFFCSECECAIFFCAMVSHPPSRPCLFSPPSPSPVQRSAKRWFPGCVNAAGKARQKW